MRNRPGRSVTSMSPPGRKRDPPGDDEAIGHRDDAEVVLGRALPRLLSVCLAHQSEEDWRRKQSGGE